MRSTISIVIPCLNEAAGLGEVLSRLPSWIDQVVVADNGSTDGSVALARRYGAQVVVEPNRGYGLACLAGLRQCVGEIIGVLDGDGSYPAEWVGPLLERLVGDDLEVLFCTRFPLQDLRALPRIRRIGNWFSRQVVKSLYGYPLKDIHSGMWFFRRELLPLAERLPGGMGFSPGFKLRVLATPGLKISEHPIPFRPRLGQAKFRAVRDSFEMCRVMMRHWISP